MSAEAGVPFAGPPGVRLVASHCPGCCQELDQPYMAAHYTHQRLTRRIQYFLCKPCGQRLERAGRANRRRFADTVERNLSEMGALVGLERVGGEA